MKAITLLLFMLMTCYADAQKPLFVRVYDLTGKKVYKGKVTTVSDSSLQLQVHSKTLDIPVKTIGIIRTKRSAGNNVLWGSVIGATTIAIIAAATAEPDEEFYSYSPNAEASAGAGAILGLPLGAAVGGITTLFKNSETYNINGDPTKWKEFESMIAGRN